MTVLLKKSQQGFSFSPVILNGNEFTSSLYVPYKCLIINTETPHSEFCPPEEIDHFSRIREPIKTAQIYEYLIKTRCKDYSKKFEVINAWSHIVEGCALAYEEVDLTYGRLMREYRKRFASQFSVPITEIHPSKEELQVKKEIVRAYKNMISRYKGKTQHKRVFNNLVGLGLALSGPSGFAKTMRKMGEIKKDWKDDDFDAHWTRFFLNNWDRGEKLSLPQLLVSSKISPFAVGPKHFVYESGKILFDLIGYSDLEDLPEIIDTIFLTILFSALELHFFNLLLVLPKKEHGQTTMIKTALQFIPSAQYYEEANRLDRKYNSSKESICEVERALNESHNRLQDASQHWEREAFHFGNFLIYDWRNRSLFETRLAQFIGEFKSVAEVVERVFREKEEKCNLCLQAKQAFKDDACSDWFKAGNLSQTINIFGRRNLGRMLDQMSDSSDFSFIEV